MGPLLGQSPKGIKIPLVVQKLRPFYRRGGFSLLVELHREGSAPALCAAGLFLELPGTFLELPCTFCEGASRYLEIVLSFLMSICAI